MGLVSWAEKEAFEHVGCPVLIEKFKAMAQTEAGKKPQTIGGIQMLYAFCGIFLGVMKDEDAASFLQTGFQGILFSQETMEAIENARQKIIAETKGKK